MRHRRIENNGELPRLSLAIIALSRPLDTRMVIGFRCDTQRPCLTRRSEHRVLSTSSQVRRASNDVRGPKEVGLLSRRPTPPQSGQTARSRRPVVRCRYRPQAAVAAIEKQPLQFIRLPLCRVPADRFGRLEPGASGAATCFAVRTLYRVFSASSRHPVRCYPHIRRGSIELLAVADEVGVAVAIDALEAAGRALLSAITSPGCWTR